MKRLIQIIAVLLGMLALFICLRLGSSKQGGKELEKYSVTYTDVFDTVTQIVSYEESQEAFDKKAKALHEELLSYHRLFDIYNSYEGLVNLKTINEEKENVEIKIDNRIMELLTLGKTMCETTKGKMDITYGAVLSIWHTYRQAGIENESAARLPDMNQLTEARGHCGFQLVELDEKNLTLRKLDSKLTFDVGSIGKGFAAKKVSELAGKLGMENCLISVGGNVVTRGDKACNTPWTIGIQNPDGNDQDYLMAVKVKNAALVTSGDYQRYYMVDGKRYCHIMDVDTLMPKDTFRSVSVLTKDSAVADALSTGLFCLSLEEGRKLVAECPDTEAVWVLDNGDIIFSDDFESFVGGK